MTKQRRNVPDDSLEAWQEWMSHPPGYDRISGRIPPTSRHGRRPTKAGYVPIVLGGLLLACALGIALLRLLSPLDAQDIWTVAGIPGVGGALLMLYGWRLVHPLGSKRRHRQR